MRHFLSLADLTAAELRAILDDAHKRKATRQGLSKGAVDADAPLSGQTLAMIFEKSSTRTRFSFEQAMRQLGGSSIVATAGTMQLGRGEPIKDTARVLSRYVDGVMMRVNAHGSLTEFADYADVPLINGLSDYNHPCQIMADLMTLEERGVDLSKAKLAWVGDGNNVLMSFVNCAAAFGFELHIASPSEYSIDPAALDNARKGEAKITTHASAADAVSDADAVIADCFVSMGDTDKDERLAALMPFQVNDALMARAKSDAIFLHCLPAYRGQEVTEDVMEGPQSAIWDEAENRLHAQKAVLVWAMAGSKP